MTTAAAVLVVGRPLRGPGMDVQALAEQFGLLVPPLRPGNGGMRVGGGLSGSVLPPGWAGRGGNGPGLDSTERSMPWLKFCDLSQEEEAPEGLEGYHCLSHGHGYFGVEVRCVWDQWSALDVAELNLQVSHEDKTRALEICDAIPPPIVDSGVLLPFGTYLVGTEG